MPIVNENDTVATEEIRFSDNDRLAALVAHLIRADALVLLSDVDALMTVRPRSPDLHPWRKCGASRPRGLHDRWRRDFSRKRRMRTKVQAAQIATDAGMPVVLTSIENAAAALAGEQVGTLFYPSGRRRPSRLLWLQHGSDVQGQVVLDDGQCAR